jgi:hypothetical protein
MPNTRKGPTTAPSELISNTEEFNAQIENSKATQPQDEEIPFGQLEDFGSPPTGLLAVLLAPRRWFEKKCAWFSIRIRIEERDREWRRERVRDYDYDYDGGYELDLECRLEALDYGPPWWEAPLMWLRPWPGSRLYYRTSLFLGWLLGGPGPFPRWIIWFWRLPLPVQRGLASLLYDLGRREAAWERQRHKEMERQRREAQPPAREAA